jgi:hypothetical protein
MKTAITFVTCGALAAAFFLLTGASSDARAWTAPTLDVPAATQGGDVDAHGLTTAMTASWPLGQGTYVHRYSSSWFKTQEKAAKYAPGITEAELGRKRCGGKGSAKIHSKIIDHCKYKSRAGYKCRLRFSYTCR